MAIANLTSSQSIDAWYTTTNKLLTTTVNSPLFNAKSFRANGGAFIVSSNTFLNGITTANGRSFIVNANSVFKGSRSIFQTAIVANGASLTSAANVSISGRLTLSGARNLLNRVEISGDVEGNHLVSTANVVLKGVTNIVRGNLTANGSTVSLRANTTITASNTNIYGKNLFVRANTTFQGSNTNIRGKSLLVAANTFIEGSFEGVDLQDLQNVASANSGEVLIYYSANNTWAGGIIDGGTY